jgi:hypothetical protein
VRRGNIRIVLTVATVVARHGNEAVVEPVVGIGGGCVWRESGSKLSVTVWMRLAEIWLQ